MLYIGNLIYIPWSLELALGKLMLRGSQRSTFNYDICYTSRSIEDRIPY